MIVAIDFTKSNGNRLNADSLHFVNSKNPNQYQKAILAISDILMKYDTDKKIPCFGFGADPKI